MSENLEKAFNLMCMPNILSSFKQFSSHLMGTAMRHHVSSPLCSKKKNMTHAPQKGGMMGTAGVPLLLILTKIRNMDSALTEVSNSHTVNLFITETLMELL